MHFLISLISAAPITIFFLVLQFVAYIYLGLFCFKWRQKEPNSKQAFIGFISAVIGTLSTLSLVAGIFAGGWLTVQVDNLNLFPIIIHSNIESAELDRDLTAPVENLVEIVREVSYQIEDDLKAEVYASSFVYEPARGLTYSFSNDPGDSIRIFNCTDIGRSIMQLSLLYKKDLVSEHYIKANIHDPNQFCSNTESVN